MGVSNFKYITVHSTLKNSWNQEGVLNVYYARMEISCESGVMP